MLGYLDRNPPFWILISHFLGKNDLDPKLNFISFSFCNFCSTTNSLLFSKFRQLYPLENTRKYRLSPSGKGLYYPPDLANSS